MSPAGPAFVPCDALTASLHEARAELAGHALPPWGTDDRDVLDGDLIIGTFGEAEDAAFAVRAVNAHAVLVEALGDVLGLIESGWLVRDVSRDAEPGFALRQLEPVRKLGAAQAALALVKGQRSAARRFCGERYRDATDGDYFTCALAPGHEGDHE